MKSPMLLLLFAALAVSAAEPAKVYTWKDEKGVVHYSDKPHANATELTVEHSPSYAIPKADTNILKPQEQPVASGPRWQLSITSPAQEETVRENEGKLTVVVDLSPQMIRGQRLQLFMDGQPFGPARTVPVIEVDNVDRGEHQIKVQLINRDNKIAAESPSRLFYMQRASIFSPTHSGGN